MSIGMRSEDTEREIEIGIVRAFGWAVIEFEAALFQKFLVMSAASSLITEEMFRKHLKDMEAKGFLTPVDFHGKRAWKRLVIESDIDTQEQNLTPDEIRALLDQAREREKITRERVHGEKIVSESRALAENILRSLEKGLIKQQIIRRRIGEPTMIDHIEAMRHALAGSREEFLKYVKDNIPHAYKDMERFVESKGEEVVLLSLRIIESGSQAYPP